MKRKITFDKVEVKTIGKFHTEAERKLSVPLNHHLEKGIVQQVGTSVEGIKKGDVVLFLTVSKNPVKGDISYLRDKEILFIYDEDTEELSTLGEDVNVELTKEDDKTDKGIILPQGVSEGVLKKAKVIAINPNKNSLGLKKGDNIWFKEHNGERLLVYNNTFLLREYQIVYTS